jgi:hypothetical protein
MSDTESLAQLYNEVDQFVGELQSENETHLAAILTHRLHNVAWTGPQELLEELHSVLAKYLEVREKQPPMPLTRHARAILENIERALRANCR